MRNFAIWMIRVGLFILVLLALGPIGIVCAILIKCIIDILKKKGVITITFKKKEDEEP